MKSLKKIFTFILLIIASNASAVTIGIGTLRNSDTKAIDVPIEGLSVGELKTIISDAYDSQLHQSSIIRLISNGTPIDLSDDSALLTSEVIAQLARNGTSMLIIDKSAADNIILPRDIIKEKAIKRQAQLNRLWTPTSEEYFDWFALTGPAGAYSGSEMGLKMIEDKILEYGGTLEPLD